jgi:hypothetical protein
MGPSLAGQGMKPRGEKGPPFPNGSQSRGRPTPDRESKK